MQLFEEHIKRTQEDNMAMQKENSKPTQKRRPFSSIVDFQDSEKVFDQRNGQTLLQVSRVLIEKGRTSESEIGKLYTQYW